MEKTDKELLQLKAIELAKMEQPIKAKPESEYTQLDIDTLKAVQYMSEFYRNTVDSYNRLIDHLRAEYK